MYKCPGCGIEHEFDVCPYCGRLKQKQTSPSSLRLPENAADTNASDDGQIRLTGAASERLRKNARDGHRPPPAPKNQPTLLRESSPVFAPDPSFTRPEEPAYGETQKKTSGSSAASSRAAEADEVLSAYFAAVAAQLTAAPEVETNSDYSSRPRPKKTQDYIRSAGNNDNHSAAENQNKSKPQSGKGQGRTQGNTRSAGDNDNRSAAENQNKSKPQSVKGQGKTQSNTPSAGDNDTRSAAENQNKSKPKSDKGQGKTQGKKSSVKAKSDKKTAAKGFADIFDDDAEPDIFRPDDAADGIEEIRSAEPEQDLEPIAAAPLTEEDYTPDESAPTRPRTRAAFREEYGDQPDQPSEIADTEKLSTSDAAPQPESTRAKKAPSAAQNSAERLSAKEYFSAFFRHILSGNLAEAMGISANGGVYYGWIFGIIGIAAGALCGLTGMKLIGTNAFATLSSAICGGIILRLETLAVLTLILWITMLTSGIGAGFSKAFSLACVSTLPTGIFSLLALGAAWFYPPLALPVLMCSAVFTALNLYGAARALGVLSKKGGFVFFGIMLSVYFIVSGLIIGSML